MWKFNTFTRRLGVSYPIVQGPFGGGLSSIPLLAAVSNGGGLGSFGAHYMTPAQIIELTRDIRGATARPFALNLWISDHDPGGLAFTPEQFSQTVQRFKPWFDELELPLPEMPQRVTERYEEQIEALLEAAPPVFSFVFGIPSADVLEQCRRRNIVTIGAATTVDEAVAIADAGVDVVLATGFEAGGHRVAFLKPAEQSLMGTFALVPQVADRVSIPVIAAGGIVDGRGVAAALTLGAQAVQLGTAFLACSESGASAIHRDTLFSPRAQQTVLSRAFTGRLARFIPNRFIAEMEQHQEAILPFPLQSWFTAQLKKAATARHDPEFSSLYASQATPLLSQRSATALMESLVAETEQIMTGRREPGFKMDNH